MKTLHVLAVGAGEERAFLELARNAERYLWLRSQNWNDGLLAVVADPKQAVKLGHDCPSLDRLDAAIDAAILAEQTTASAAREG